MSNGKRPVMAPRVTLPVEIATLPAVCVNTPEAREGTATALHDALLLEAGALRVSPVEIRIYDATQGVLYLESVYGEDAKAAAAVKLPVLVRRLKLMGDRGVLLVGSTSVVSRIARKVNV